MKPLVLITAILMIISVGSQAAQPISKTIQLNEYISGYTVSAVESGVEVSPQTTQYKIGKEVFALDDGLCEKIEYKLTQVKKIQSKYGEISLPIISKNTTSGPC